MDFINRFSLRKKRFSTKTQPKQILSNEIIALNIACFLTPDDKIDVSATCKAIRKICIENLEIDLIVGVDSNENWKRTVIPWKNVRSLSFGKWWGTKNITGFWYHISPASYRDQKFALEDFHKFIQLNQTIFDNVKELILVAMPDSENLTYDFLLKFANLETLFLWNSYYDKEAEERREKIRMQNYNSDGMVQEEIEQQIKNPPKVVFDIAKHVSERIKILRLYGFGENILNIEHLSKFENLKEIGLRFSDCVVDLNVIPKNVEVLDLTHCKSIKDYSPLLKLPKLQKLAGVADIDFVPKTIKGYSGLSTGYHDHKSIPKLGKFTQLEEFVIEDYNARDSMSSLGVISSLEIKTLGLSFNNISDFSQLQNFSKLEELNVSSSGFNDLDYIPTSIRMLDLSSCHIVYFEPLKRFTHLIQLDLRENKSFQDLSVLPTSLEDLSIASCYKIVDFSPLAQLINLTQLDLGTTGIENLQVIPKQIKILTISYCRDLKDFTPLRKLKKLRQLRAWGTPIDGKSIKSI